MMIGYLLDGDRCDLDAFLASNELDPADEAAIRSLRPGQTFRGGGGAWAEWIVEAIEVEPELTPEQWADWIASVGPTQKE